MSRVFSKGVTPSVLPVHIEQKIALSRPLKLACDYHLRVTVDPAPGRKTFRVTGRILTLDSEEIGSLLTTIALVEIPARAGK